MTPDAVHVRQAQLALGLGDDQRSYMTEVVGEPFRPSNATIGDSFDAGFCARCRRDIDQRCPILTAAMVHEIDEPAYPKQWISDGRGDRCTAFEEKQS